MRFKILINYILGFVDIIVEGYYIERFINLCTSRGIFIWNVKRDKATILCARVGIKNFKKLKNICKKTQCKMKIQNKKGLPFILNQYKKRKIFVGLLILMFLIIISLSNFIWNIEITGNTKIKAEEILQVASDNGLSIGKWKHSIETKEIINQLRLQRDDIAWVGIEIKGTNLIIKIVEADMKPEIIDEEDYCNVVAGKDAEILKVSAVNGTPLVKEGDIVKKGDIVIAGWLEGKYTGVRYVHAQGEVEAKVSYTNKQRIYLKETKKEETGVLENKYSVNINNFKINFYKKLSNFENYDTIEENKKIKLFSDFYLPIIITKITNREYQNVEVNYTTEEAKQKGIEQAENELNSQIKNSENILDKKIVTHEEIEYIDVEVTYEVRENIGTKEKIVF